MSTGILSSSRRIWGRLLAGSRYCRPRARRHVARVVERLFEGDWYASRNGIDGSINAREHFVAVGAWIGLSPHPLLDPVWLCRDPRDRGVTQTPGPHARSRAILRFISSSPSSAVDPHPLFDVAWYQASARLPDDAEIDLLTHFLLQGERAGHSPHPLIDPTILRREHECARIASVNDVAGIGRVPQEAASPLTEYAAGRILDARTHELFDSSAYRAINSDVALAGAVPLEHYIRSGRSERRSTLRPVDEGWARVRWGVQQEAPFEPLELARDCSELTLSDARGALVDELRGRLRHFVQSDPTPSTRTWADARGARLTVIIPVWNKAHATLQCLQALQTATVGLRIRVHIVDNGSTDETPAVLERFPGITVTRWEENRGYGAAVNHAAQSSETELLLLLNNDAFVEPDAIRNALQVLDTESKAGAVCARIVLPNGMLQEAGSYVLPDGSSRGHLRGERPSHPEALHRRDVDFGSAAFLLIRREVFVSLGGFRPEFGLAYGEDVDLMLRMWDSGWRAVYEPSCVVQHLEGESTDGSADAAARMRHAARIIRDAHAPLLSSREADSTRRIAQARASGPHIVVIDDEVPDRRCGAGQPRAIEILTELIARHKAQITLLTRSVVRTAAERANARIAASAIDPRVALHAGLTPDLWVDWLDENADRVDLVWISRSHNMVDLRRELARRQRERLALQTVFDSEAFVVERDAALAAHLGSPWAQERLAIAREEEISCATAADVVVCAAEHEAHHYRSRMGVPVRVLGHRVDVPVARFAPPLDSRLLFIGRLAEPASPNSLGLRWFLENVMPGLEEHVDVTIDIAGLSGEWLEEFRSDQVNVLGPVRDLEPLYRLARVFVAPTFFAAGIPLKVLEAASRGLPVVTTGIVARQIGLADGINARVASAAECFKSAIVELLNDERAWMSISEGGRQMALDTCSPKKFAREVSRILRLARGGCGVEECPDGAKTWKPLSAELHAE